MISNKTSLTKHQIQRLRYKMRDPERFRILKQRSDARYREKNKENKKLRDAEYRAKNSEKVKAQKAAYYRANKDKYRVKNAEWYKENRENYLIYAKTYRELRGEQIKVAVKKWYATHPERRRYLSAKKEARRRARLRGNRTENYCRNSILVRDAYTCHLCGDAIDKTLRFPHAMCFTIDHVIPLIKGGADASDNVAAAHFLCNMKKGSKLLTAI
jgi:5-methylcytosine-specific restriction endonuclease McrA